MKALHVIGIVALVAAAAGGGYFLRSSESDRTTITDVEQPQPESEAPAPQAPVQAPQTPTPVAQEDSGINAAVWFSNRIDRERERNFRNIQSIVSERSFVSPVHQSMIVECIVERMDRTETIGGVGDRISLPRDWRRYLQIIDALERGRADEFTGADLNIARHIRDGWYTPSRECVEERIPIGEQREAIREWQRMRQEYHASRQ